MTEVKETPLETPQPEKIEQITKEPEKQAEKAEKIEDPKKLRAGKALVKKDKKPGKRRRLLEKSEKKSRVTIRPASFRTSNWLDPSSVPVSFLGTDGPSQNPL